MNNYRIAIGVICAIVLAGCTLLSPHHPTLSSGRYTMESSITKTGVKRDQGGSSQCTVTVQRSSIRIDGLSEAKNAWFEGTLIGQHIVLTVQQRNPDPMIKAMQLRQVFEGQVTADDIAEGTMEGFAGTNAYLHGTWKLTKTK